MKFYEMVVRVSGKNLTTVMAVVEDCTTLVSLKQIEEDADTKPSREPRIYANGKRDKGVKGVDLVEAILADGTARTVKDIGNEMAKRGGFSADSASPVLSQLYTAKKVVRVGTGIWQKAPITG